MQAKINRLNRSIPELDADIRLRIEQRDQLRADIEGINDQLNNIVGAEGGQHQWDMITYDDLGHIPGVCFCAGTPVHTPDGERPIETLAAGDLVLSYDFEAQAVVTRPVTAAHGNWTQRIVHIAVGGATILATRMHPFWVEDAQEWRPAHMLRPGMVLRAIDRPLPVQSAATVVAEAATYNIEVAGTHTYFAGAAGVLVHNGDGDTNVQTSSYILKPGEQPQKFFFYYIVHIESGSASTWRTISTLRRSAATSSMGSRGSIIHAREMIYGKRVLWAGGKQAVATM